jgi:hypothetical protein
MQYSKAKLIWPAFGFLNGIVFVVDLELFQASLLTKPLTGAHLGSLTVWMAFATVCVLVLVGYC